MDSTADRSEPAWKTHSLIWPPLLILIIGAALSWFAAHALSVSTHHLSEQVYRQQHRTLVAWFEGHTSQLAQTARQQDVPSAPTMIPETIEGQLERLFRNLQVSGMDVRLDNLERHSKVPLFQKTTASHPDRSQSLRTEIHFDGIRLLLTTTPDTNLLDQPAERAWLTVWLTGLLITGVGAVVAILLGRRLLRMQQAQQQEEAVSKQLDRRLENMQVEKSILRRALNDSEQRSRDLVELSGAMIGELDEEARIGYLSPQIASLLDRAPADQTGKSLIDLVQEADRDNFRKTLSAARQERRSQRIDLCLLNSREEPVPVALRVLALQDMVHGFAGYRVSALQRTPQVGA